MKKKTAILTARLTPAEKAAVERRAQQANMTVTDYIVKCALGKNVRQIDELSPAGVHTFSGMNLPVSRLLYPQLQKDYMKLLFAEREEL